MWSFYFFYFFFVSGVNPDGSGAYRSGHKSDSAIASRSDLCLLAISDQSNPERRLVIPRFGFRFNMYEQLNGNARPEPEKWSLSLESCNLKEITFPSIQPVHTEYDLSRSQSDRHIREERGKPRKQGSRGHPKRGGKSKLEGNEDQHQRPPVFPAWQRVRERPGSLTNLGGVDRLEPVRQRLKHGKAETSFWSIGSS